LSTVSRLSLVSVKNSRNKSSIRTGLHNASARDLDAPDCSQLVRKAFNIG
jgi:hypothetical protein